MAKITDSFLFGARVNVLSDYMNTVLQNHPCHWYVDQISSQDPTSPALSHYTASMFEWNLVLDEQKYQINCYTIATFLPIRSDTELANIPAPLHSFHVKVVSSIYTTVRAGRLRPGARRVLAWITSVPTGWIFHLMLCGTVWGGL